MKGKVPRFPSVTTRKKGDDGKERDGSSLTLIMKGKKFTWVHIC